MNDRYISLYIIHLVHIATTRCYHVFADADQAHNYKSACETNPTQEWDCTMWTRFGVDFAYVQTGIYDYMNSGTTLAISKKGSGLSETLDPCIDAFIQTQSYKNLCTKYNIEDSCFQTKFFDSPTTAKEPYSIPTNELTTSCFDGYCPCMNDSTPTQNIESVATKNSFWPHRSPEEKKTKHKHQNTTRVKCP